MKDNKIYINTKHIIDNNKKFKLEYIKVNDESNNPIEIDIGIENPIFKKELLIIIVFFITYNLNYLLFIFPRISSSIIKYLFLLLYAIFFPYYLINREIKEIKSDIMNYIEKIFKSIENDNIEKYNCNVYYSSEYKINIKKILNIHISIYK